LAVKVFRIVAESIVIGVVPLRCIVRESIREPCRMSNPEIGWVRESITVNVATPESVEPANPSRIDFFWR
jgi:hypothetical protein